MEDHDDDRDLAPIIPFRRTVKTKSTIWSDDGSSEVQEIVWTVTGPLELGEASE